MPARGPEPVRPRHATTAAPAPSAGDGAAVAASPDRGGSRGRGVLTGLALGAGVGVLGTLTHLNLAPVAGVAVPWGLALALLLAGSTQRWWMRVSAQRGAHPVPAGGAVVIGAFTVAVALHRLPATDQLGLPWTAEVARAVPTALLASVGWLAGLPVLGAVMLVLGARRRGPRPAPEGRTGESTLGGTPNPVPVREVDGQP
ncbi:hypothetical protein [Micrococcus sp.]|uniref:hypothetical protein n=1 Tax=Micrococcus sp. TaxID=1271 RepID=UPI0026DD95D3|nr:hypothetical protein [Micrococcus sp.]MDO4239310.1 hypothetical protein [Micrococcus sp.]